MWSCLYKLSFKQKYLYSVKKKKSTSHLTRTFYKTFLWLVYSDVTQKDVTNPYILEAVLMFVIFAL